VYKIERTSNEKSKDCAPGSCNKRKSEQPDDHLYKRLLLSLPVVPVQSPSHVNDNNQLKVGILTYSNFFKTTWI